MGDLVKLILDELAPLDVLAGAGRFLLLPVAHTVKQQQFFIGDVGFAFELSVRISEILERFLNQTVLWSEAEANPIVEAFC